MVRDATQDDVVWLYSMAERFNAAYFDIPLNPAKSMDFFSTLIDSPTGVCLISQTGAIIGTVVTDPLRDWTILVELGWYSEGNDGLRLLRAFEKRGKLCDEIRMSTMRTSPDVANYVLRKSGYTLQEMSYRKLT